MIEIIKDKALKEGVPIIKDEGLAFLLNFIKENHPKKILELGTAVGYSAMEMAKLDPEIHIDTIEKKEDMYNQAIVNIKENGFESQISCNLMAIEDFKTDEKYDLIFVDAAKAQYDKYTEMFLPNLKEDGYMLYDNMIFHGLVFKIDEIESKNLRNMVKKIAKFREKVANDNRFDIMLYDNIGDGILVLRRRKNAG